MPPRQTVRFAGAQWCRDHRGELIGWLPEVVVADPRRVAFVLQEARDPETGWNPGWLTEPEARAFHRFVRHHAGESRAWGLLSALDRKIAPSGAPAAPTPTALVDEATWHAHIDAFISSFVVKDKRARWQHLCLEKPEKAARASHRMYNDLVWAHCSKIEDASAIARRYPRGVYYDFAPEASWLSAEKAFAIGHGSESIFSIRQGEVAIYFWHELEEYLCLKA